MKIKSEKLEINKSLYNKLNNLCMFSKDITLDVINGIVFKELDTVTVTMIRELVEELKGVL